MVALGQDNIEQKVEVEVTIIDDAFFEHGDAQSDDVICLDIDSQVQEDDAEFLINTIIT